MKRSITFTGDNLNPIKYLKQGIEYNVRYIMTTGMPVSNIHNSNFIDCI